MISTVVYFTTSLPEDVRLVKECRALVDGGFSVTVIGPGARDGSVHGIRFANVHTAAGGRLRRASSAMLRLVRMVVFEHRADVYMFHDPALLPLGLVLRCLGRKVVYDVYEDVRRDIRTKPYLSPTLARILSAVFGSMEWVMGRVASHVIAATPHLATQFPSGRTTTIHNYPIVADDAADFTLDEYRARRPGGVYVGAMTTLRKAPEMFAAADAVRSRCDEFRFVVAGPTFGIEDPSEHAGVDYRGVVPVEDVPGLLAGARFGVSLLADEPHLAVALPTKFYEYAGAGLPSIVSRSNVTITSIMNDARCGVMVDETSPEAIADAMRWMLEHPEEAYEMGRRGAAVVRERYQWANEAERLLTVYRSL